MKSENGKMKNANLERKGPLPKFSKGETSKKAYKEGNYGQGIFKKRRKERLGA